MKTALGIIVVIVLALGVWLSLHLGQTAPTSLGSSMGVVSYSCDAGKTISAEYFKGVDTPGTSSQPPIPGGAVKLALSDGRNLTLKQTISADGARYSDGDPQKELGQSGAESFVFWSKGNGALVLENNEAKSYIGCISVVKDPGSLSQVYSSGAQGFSIRYPAGYTLDEGYNYLLSGTAATPSRISGVKFTIDPAIATGTNLASDSYASVEQIPQAGTCSADKFLDLANGGKAQDIQDGDTQYSFASTSDAAAGNRYEEAVYALPGTNPCIAVRYFLHYGAIGNYPQGAVDEFDRSALVRQFDSIRRTLTVSQ
jgi:membrane-bound inhibitor of C-type lysozyme